MSEEHVPVRLEETPRLPLRPESDRLSLRTALASPAEDFQSALAAVTGTFTDLRAAADPPGGFLKLSTPGGEHWWSFSAFGTDLFSVDLNMAALDAWATAIDKVEDIDHDLFSGTYGLMNLKLLRDAETMTQSLTATVAEAVDRLKAIVTPLENETTISGTAVSVLLDQLHLIGDQLHANEIELTKDPSPAVTDVLHAAAEALSTWGQQMAYIYWQSNQVLLNAVAIGANGISQNVQAYLRQAGLTSDSPRYRALATDPVAAAAEARQVIGRYSSSVSGDLPNGIAPISGDLGQPAVWAAANAAITHLITVELDKMDVVARKVTADLKTAYDNASTRLNAPTNSFPAQPTLPDQPDQADQPYRQALRTVVKSETPRR